MIPNELLFIVHQNMTNIKDGNEASQINSTWYQLKKCEFVFQKVMAAGVGRRFIGPCMQVAVGLCGEGMGSLSPSLSSVKCVRVA